MKTREGDVEQEEGLLAMETEDVHSLEKEEGACGRGSCSVMKVWVRFISMFTANQRYETVGKKL
jgi:hypothetical protein